MDENAIRSYLLTAPKENFKKSNNGVVLSIPLPNGEYEEFRVYESSAMMDGLQSRYPNIRSFKGQSMVDKKKIIRLNFGPKGFRAAIRTSEGSIYIDPYYTKATGDYLSYYTKDVQTIDGESFRYSCGLDEDMAAEVIDYTDQLQEKEIDWSKSATGDSLGLQTYRFALTCTGEWGNRGRQYS